MNVVYRTSGSEIFDGAFYLLWLAIFLAARYAPDDTLPKVKWISIPIINFARILGLASDCA
jgi:hypothetical protein